MMTAHTGDMSIGEQYTGQLLTNQYPFSNIQTGFKSICVTTRDQGLPGPGYSPSSPTCFYEFNLGYCRIWKWIYYPGFPVEQNELTPAGRRNLRNGSGDITNVDVTNVDGPLEPEIQRVPLDKVIGAEKIVQAVREVTGNNSFQAGPTPVDEDGEVSAIEVDKEFQQYNPKYTQLLCPQLGCYIPYYVECRSGGYTAHGSGPENLKITGGSLDFYGGFGQVSILLLHDDCNFCLARAA